MSDFRTIVSLSKSPFEISYSDKIALIGSCFSNHISANLASRKFKVLSNPYGIVFNPMSLFNSLDEIIDGKVFKESHLVFHNELEHSLNHHTEFSNPDPAKVLKEINSRIIAARDFLQDAQVLFLTFGTSWVYSYEGEIVANCHKIPNHQFEKRILSSAEIVDAYGKLKQRLEVFNPGLHVVFTVSPVRHLKDGMEENSVSKAILRNAIHQIQQSHTETAYFPSYEIMMDDLRDYRFYEKDMLHPNQQAIEYIWKKFSEHYMNDETRKLMNRIEKLEAAINHKPRFPESEAHKKHLTFVAREKQDLQRFYEGSEP